MTARTDDDSTNEDRFGKQDRQGGEFFSQLLSEAVRRQGSKFFAERCLGLAVVMARFALCYVGLDVSG